MSWLLLLAISGTAMTIPYRILGTDEQARPIVDQVFAEVDETYNDWNPASEVSRFNNWPADKPFPASPALLHLLHRVDELVSLSRGRFDPTVGAQTHGGGGPTGWDKIQIVDGHLIKLVAGLQLDLGGVAKGHAVDLLIARLQSAGYADLYVDWGGEISVAGRPRRIAVRHPRVEEPLAVLDLQEAAVATSGDYIQGRHILNPLTLSRPDVVTSATVVARDCLTADALATAAMLCASKEEAEAFVSEIEAVDSQFQVLICLTN